MSHEEESAISSSDTAQDFQAEELLHRHPGQDVSANNENK